MMIDPSAVTVERAAEIIGVTTGRIRQLLRSGDLSGQKITERCWLVSRESALQYRDCERKPGPRPVQNS